MTQPVLTPLQIIVRDCVYGIQLNKRENGIIPDFVTTDEIIASIRDEITETLRTLYRAHMVEHHLTVNKVSMFGIINAQ